MANNTPVVLNVDGLSVGETLYRIRVVQDKSEILSGYILVTVTV